MGVCTITSGLEGAWTPTPTKWDNSYFETLFGCEWELTKSPYGAHQWTPKGGTGAGTVPDAHDPSRRHAPMMTTADLALRFDPAYEKISRRFMKNPAEFADAFARAWYKLTHRDMDPVSRYLGPLVPKEELLWQDPVPAVDHPLVNEQDIEALEAKVLAAGLSISQLVTTAWASASTFRGGDKRGGANGARIRLQPQKEWEANQPTELGRILSKLEAVRKEFNAGQPGGRKISMADLIVLAGNAVAASSLPPAGFGPGAMAELVPAELGRGTPRHGDQADHVHVSRRRLDPCDLGQVEHLGRLGVERHVFNPLRGPRLERKLQHRVETLHARERRHREVRHEELVVRGNGAVDAAVVRQAVFTHPQALRHQPVDERARGHRPDEAGLECGAHAFAERNEPVERLAAVVAGHEVRVDRLGGGRVGLVQPPRKQHVHADVAARRGDGGRARRRRRAHAALRAPPSTQRRNLSMPRCRITRTLPAVRPSCPATASDGWSS